MANFNGTASSDLDTNGLAEGMNEAQERLAAYNAQQEEAYRRETESTFEAINTAVDRNRQRQQVALQITATGPVEAVAETVTKAVSKTVLVRKKTNWLERLIAICITIGAAAMVIAMTFALLIFAAIVS